MPTIMMLYPAYGSVSSHEVCRYAENMGDIRMVLADDTPTASDFDIFDEVWELPPPEQVKEAYERLRRWCAKNRPGGIFLQSERGLLVGSLIAREFGLKGPPIEAAHLCSNKYLQRVALSKAGIGNPIFALGENASDIHRLAARAGFPVVLKCVISTMSRLVTLVNSKEEIEPAVARVKAGIEKSTDVARLLSFADAAKVDLGCDPRRQFLIESFLGGDMVETDGLLLGDKPYTFGVTEQVQSVDPPFFIEAYLFPAECTDNGAVESVSDATVEALGLRDSAFSIEMRVQDDVVRIVEVNGRLGWDEGFTDMFRIHTHQDRITQALKLCLGIAPEVVHDNSRHAALAYRSCYYDGIVEELPSKDEISRLGGEGVRLGLATNKGARFFSPPGSEVYPHVAWALATHPSSSRAAHAIARQTLEKLDIVIAKL
ncbi:MAG: ATP-grasp domain-containing protein [Chloroflexi bacterium]|nr:ATP-grasp domain-containing protein [Chloroflexota bacterium]